MQNKYTTHRLTCHWLDNNIQHNAQRAGGVQRDTQQRQQLQVECKPTPNTLLEEPMDCKQKHSKMFVVPMKCKQAYNIVVEVPVERKTNYDTSLEVPLGGNEHTTRSPCKWFADKHTAQSPRCHLSAPQHTLHWLRRQWSARLHDGFCCAFGLERDT